MKTGRPCVPLGMVVDVFETPNNKEAPMERVYTIGADTHCAFTELQRSRLPSRPVRLHQVEHVAVVARVFSEEVDLCLRGFDHFSLAVILRVQFAK